MKRKLVLFTLLIFSYSTLFAAPGLDFHKKGHKNFHGKRMMEEDEEFNLIFVKATELKDFHNIRLVFSQQVNPVSIGFGNLQLNGKEVQLKKILFSKNYRIIDLVVEIDEEIWAEENQENPELTVKNIESINGNKIEPVVIENFEMEKDYKLMKKFER